VRNGESTAGTGLPADLTTGCRDLERRRCRICRLPCSLGPARLLNFLPDRLGEPEERALFAKSRERVNTGIDERLNASAGNVLSVVQPAMPRRGQGSRPLSRYPQTFASIGSQALGITSGARRNDVSACVDIGYPSLENSSYVH
jgi:hypothetical protein